MNITEQDVLARLIFVADNSNAPNPVTEWAMAGPHHRQYARDIAAALTPLIEAYGADRERNALLDAADDYRQPALKVGTAPDMVRAWLLARADQ